MTTQEQLIERHIREYESRLKHIDELYQRAQTAVEQREDIAVGNAELMEIAQARSLLPGDSEELRTLDLENWQKETVQGAGPMAIWDILAQRLEAFIERHE